MERELPSSSYAPWYSSVVPAPSIFLPPLFLEARRTEQEARDELEGELSPSVPTSQQLRQPGTVTTSRRISTSSLDADVPRCLPELWSPAVSRAEGFESMANGGDGDETMLSQGGLTELNGGGGVSGNGWSNHVSAQHQFSWRSSTPRQQPVELRERMYDEDEDDSSGFEPPTGLLPPPPLADTPIRIRDSEGEEYITSPAVDRTIQERTPLRSRRDSLLQRSASFNSIRSLSASMGLSSLPPASSSAAGGSNAMTADASPYHTLNEMSGSSVRLGGSGGHANVSAVAVAGNSMLSPSVTMRHRAHAGIGNGHALELTSPQPWWPRLGVQADMVRQRPPSFGAVHPAQVHASTGHAYSNATQYSNGTSLGPSTSMQRIQLDQPSTSPHAQEETDAGTATSYMQPPSPSLGPARKRARTKGDDYDGLPVPSGLSLFARHPHKVTHAPIERSNHAEHAQGMEAAPFDRSPNGHGSQSPINTRRRVVVRWNDRSTRTAADNGQRNAHASGGSRHDDHDDQRNVDSQRSQAGPSRSQVRVSATRSTAGPVEMRKHLPLPALLQEDDATGWSEGLVTAQTSGHDQNAIIGNAGAADAAILGGREAAEPNVSSDRAPEIGPMSDLSMSSSASNSRSMMEKAAEVLASLKTSGKSPSRTSDAAEDTSADEKPQDSTQPESNLYTAKPAEGQKRQEAHDNATSPAPSSPLSSLPSEDEGDEPGPSRQGVATAQVPSSRASSNDLSADTSNRAAHLVSDQRRCFPASMPVDEAYPLLYQRYYVPSSLDPSLQERIFGGSTVRSFDREVKKEGTSGIHVPRKTMFKEPPSLLNLYAPRYIRGQGMTKEGLCPVCWESGQENFFKTKQSSYNYHMQYTHGISALTGEPFAPPIEFRTVDRPKRDVRLLEKEIVKEGRCHVCKKFVPIENVKQTEMKVPEIMWWKHAHSCHRMGKPLAGTSGTFVENAFYHRVKAYVDAHECE
ncbi:unnamed protein product [Tilletia controversa]|nr:unnamed protein product [Tilletia controversa]